MTTIYKYIAIGLGGSIGAVLRVMAKQIDFPRILDIPVYNTLLVNLIGSFALALFLGVALEVLNLGSEIRMGISTGLMGGLTTFSTLCKEVSLVFWSGSAMLAIFYLCLSIVLGLSFAYLGTTLSRLIAFRDEVRQ